MRCPRFAARRSLEEVGRLRSPLCDLVGIEMPIIQAGMSIFTSPALAAAVSEAGALGSLGAWNRPTDQLRRELAELRDLTDRLSHQQLGQES